MFLACFLNLCVHICFSRERGSRVLKAKAAAGRIIIKSSGLERKIAMSDHDMSLGCADVTLTRLVNIVGWHFGFELLRLGSFARNLSLWTLRLASFAWEHALVISRFEQFVQERSLTNCRFRVLACEFPQGVRGDARSGGTPTTGK